MMEEKKFVSKRVFVKVKDQIRPGKVIVIKSNWDFQTLLHQLGKKFELQITDIFLEIEKLGQQNLLIVEDIEEIQDGDVLLVSGLSQSIQDLTSEVQKADLSDNNLNSLTQQQLSLELNKNLIILSNQVAKLVSRLQDSNNHVEEMYKQMNKAFELQQQHFFEILKNSSQKFLASEKPPRSRNYTGIGHTAFKHVITLKEHTGPIWDLKLTSDLLISGSSDKTIKVWDLTTFKLIKTLEGHNGIVHCLGIHKGKLVSGSDDKSIRVWSLNEMKCINALYGHDNTICELEVTDKYLFSASFNIIIVWDIEKFQILTSLGGHNHWAYSMCLFNNYLISGSHNIIKVWDIETLKPVKTINTPGGKSIYCLAVTDKYLLSGTYENTIQVYNLKNFEFIKTLSEHQACVLSLSVSGQFFFSGSYDTTIKIWGLENLHVVETLHHEAKVEALVSNHKYVISGGTDNTIKIWEWKSRPTN